MSKENTEHFNIESISEFIKDIENFVVVNVLYDENDWRSKEPKKYFISPLVLDENGKIIGRNGCVYDNLDVHGKVIMSKEEMLVKFGLTFGKCVEYEMDENFGDYSDLPRTSEIRKI